MGDVVVLATFVPKDMRCPVCRELPPRPTLTFQGARGMVIDFAEVKWDFTCVCGTKCETSTTFGDAGPT